MKAIIIAAGMGSRLRPYTALRPKCMVEVRGKPILHHQLDALRAHGIEDIVVIRGYKGRAIQARGVRFVDNRDYANNNILLSLFCAGTELTGDVIVSYGDIVYGADVVGALLESPQAGALVVDTAWASNYEGRTDHPIEQAELCRQNAFDMVTEVGKSIGAEGAFGEFIGLARFDASMVAQLWARYLQAVSRGLDRPFVHAKTLRKAYLSDLINDAVQADLPFGTCPIHGGWREIDTVQDYERAQRDGW